MCGCRQFNLACSVFCECQGGTKCFNDKTRQTLQADDDDDDDDDDNDDNNDDDDNEDDDDDN